MGLAHPERASRTERFEHRCADAEPLQVQGYAGIGSEDGRANAVVLVYARRNAVQNGEVFVGVRLVAMRLEAGSGHGRAGWSVSFEARSEAAFHAGAGHSHYIGIPSRSERRRRAFRSNETGVLNWFDHPERTGRIRRAGFPCNWSPRMETTADALGLTEENRDVALGLALTERETGHAVRLDGIVVRIPNRIWHERPARSTTPDPLARLGLVGRRHGRLTAGRGVRCRRCAAERRKAMDAIPPN